MVAVRRFLPGVRFALLGAVSRKSGEVVLMPPLQLDLSRS